MPGGGRSPWVEVVRRNNWILQACTIRQTRIWQKFQKDGRAPQYAIVDTKLRRVHKLTREIRDDVSHHVHITRGEAEKAKKAEAEKLGKVPAAFCEKSRAQRFMR